MDSTSSFLAILLLLMVITTQNHALGVSSPAKQPQVNDKWKNTDDITQAQAWRRFFTNNFDDSTKNKYKTTPHIINGRDGFKYFDCDEVRQAGYLLSGYYRVWFNASIQYNVFCHHEGNVSYTTIQQRMNGNLDFHRPWQDYVQGFGSASGNYWAGLNNIYYLTSTARILCTLTASNETGVARASPDQIFTGRKINFCAWSSEAGCFTGNNILHVLLQAWTYEKRTISYQYFRVMDSTHYYMMNVGHPYLANVTDDLSYHNGMRFATYDFPDHLNCATAYKAGWWYNQCAKTLLNGKYYYGGKYHPSPYYDGIFWQDWTGLDYSMKYAAMVLSTSSTQPKHFPFN